MATPRSFTLTSTLLTALIALAVPVSGRAASPCQPQTLPAARQWSEPLARSITLRAGELSLKDALARIAEAAQVRLSYSADLLPLHRKVCAAVVASALGDVLNHLLSGVSVEPVVAGVDHVVLTPAAMRVARSEDVAPDPIYPLQPLIAEARSQDAGFKPTGYVTTRIEGSEIATHASIADAINAHVPGMWSWQSPAGIMSLFTARGASSFGMSRPKIFIDGIEVANPLLAAQIAPEEVERIEVIRGPEGAVLYGGDAMDGVTNIITRHEWQGGVPHLRVRSGVALSGSDYTGSAGIGQDHAVGVQFGSRERSGNFNFAAGSVGEYMPDAYARHLTGDGNFRIVGARFMVSGTGRVHAQSVGNPASMIVDRSLHDIAPLAMQQYTVGFTGVLRPNDKLTHSLVAGLDGYALNGSATDSTPPLSAADSLLRAWDNGLRTTLRWTTVAEVVSGARANALLTVTAEHSGLHQSGKGDAVAYAGELATVLRHPNGMANQGSAWADSTRPHPYAAIANYQQSRSANGVSAQLDGSLTNRLFVNAGLRLEHDVVAGAHTGDAWLPMLGAAYVLVDTDLSIKLRGAYGKAVRWPDASRLDWAYQRTRMTRPTLSPEQQSGLEGGVDVSFRRMAGIQLTRYDQTVSGLSQLVACPSRGYEVQSVGEIGNQGWELQAYLQRGALALSGTMALTDSKVRSLATGYTGDLQAADRMLGVPARTLSLNVAWTAADWSTSVSAARAFDWINYDRAVLSMLSTQPMGDELRNYWKHYNGFTHVRGTITRNLRPGLTMLLTGDNLLGRQIGEPDNLTVVPGRTFSFGVRASF